MNEIVNKIVVTRMPKCDLCHVNGITRAAAFEVIAEGVAMYMCGTHASRYSPSALTPLLKAP